MAKALWQSHISISKADDKNQQKQDSIMDKVETNAEPIKDFSDRNFEITEEDMELINEFLNV